MYSHNKFLNDVFIRVRSPFLSLDSLQQSQSTHFGRKARNELRLHVGRILLHSDWIIADTSMS